MKLDLAPLAKWRLASMETDGAVAAGVAPIAMRHGEEWVRFTVSDDGAGGFTVRLRLSIARRQMRSVEVKRFMQLAGFKVEREVEVASPSRAFVLRERREIGHHLIPAGQVPAAASAGGNVT